MRKNQPSDALHRLYRAKKVAVFTETKDGRVEARYWKIIGTIPQIKEKHYMEYVELEVKKRGLRLLLIIEDGDPAAEKLQPMMLQFSETLWIHEWQANAHRHPFLLPPLNRPIPLFELMLGPAPTTGIAVIDPDKQVKCFP